MRKLPLIIGIILLALNAVAQSPHGEALNIDCSDCHTTTGWQYLGAGARFSHDVTSFTLEGQHQFTDCKACHTSLVFTDAKTNCVDCHTDMHNSMLGLDCARCHTPASWIIDNVTDLHQNSRFPLVGVHKSAECADCHLSNSRLEFRPLGIECIDCHRSDYEQTTNPNHVQANMSLNCLDCHSLSSSEWNASGFLHDFFPLEKGHQIDECAACHIDGIYEATSSECYSCHQSDYELSINPSHLILGFSTNCTECHTTEVDWKPADYYEHDLQFFPIYSGSHNGSWDQCIDCHTQGDNFSLNSCIECHEHNQSDMNEEHQGVNGYSYNSIACFACHPLGNADEIFDHAATAFPLNGQHRLTSCIDCHSSGFNNISTECVDCHLEAYNQSQDPKHLEAGVSTECRDCHNENGWQPSSFDHFTTTSFELSGGHAGRQCSDCHIGTTTEAVNDCYTCHQTNYNEAREHLSLSFSHTCTECHNTTDWTDFNFDHNTTNFVLTGSHVGVDCNSCHSEFYAGTSTLCNSCHLDNYNQASDPNHSQAGISTSCEECHDTDDWKPSSFDHITSTGFALTGGHEGRQCSECHIGTTSAAISDCFSCHSTNYNEAPEHLSLGFPHDCEQCHNTVDWTDATFDHNSTDFPLTGSHIGVDCNNCHTDGYAGTSQLCQSCHTLNYNQSSNPSHLDAGISKDCEDCHETTDWIPSTFNHTSSTGFELTGGHSGRQCSDCHLGTTSAAVADCYSCHSTNYNEAPDHIVLGFPHECETCHNTNDWNDATFDHNSTDFPLTGSHIGVDCSACHTNGYAGTSNQCQACHIESYNQASDPSHIAAGISTACEDCHQTTDWIPSVFNHTTSTGFELTGGHSGRQCSDCHLGNTTSANADCYSCHAANYNSAPDHLSLGFPHDCEQCHNNIDWGDAEFDHNSTNFPLTGSHIGVDCNDCHTDGYSGTSADCSSCHIADYNQTSNPNHSSIGLSTNCDDCHTTNPDWDPATFPVHDDYYELNGAHRSISNSCYLCHAGNYINTPNTCYACHASDYNNTNDPSHSTANFPTDCESCHSESAWEPATFDHDGQYFPIYSGEHRGEWNNCSDCHTVSSNYAVFSCIDCHEHNRNDMDDEHRGISGYLYNSNSCLSCHPNGRAD